MKLNAVEFVKRVMADGIRLGVSDVHIDPFPAGSTVRFRIDGLLQHFCDIPQPIHSEVIARIKILAGLRTDVHVTPQDGRFRHEECDIRVSILPTHHGENAVIRILASPKSDLTLADLGFSANDAGRIEKILARKQGLILVTGPTGSGKTTTLYALLAMLNKSETSIVTLEDPVEYALKGISQVHVNSKYGVSFSSGLRAILRQDPDIIMVGEIRDAETARIAVHSALTGHLVLSTLHTNSAASAVPRLLDMGVESYLSAATLSLIIGQRLIRKKDKDSPSYKGRVGIYETLVVDDDIRKTILNRSPADEIADKARERGMRTMHEDGMEKVEQGMTTREELIRVLHE